MQMLVLYRPKTEYARRVEEYCTDFTHTYPDWTITLLDVESVEGIAKAQVYDILQTPAFLCLADDGQELKSWIGEEFPLMTEVAGYMRS